MHRITLAALLAVCATHLLCAQEPPTPETPAQTPPTGTALPAGRGGLPSQDPQPYEKVITKEAKSKTGIFTVHEVKDKYYYEIPKAQLNREFLWNTQIARTTEGVGYGGQELGSRVVRWEMNGNKVHLRSISYNVVADPENADRPGSAGGQQRHDHHDVSRRSLCQRRRPGDRSHPSVHHRCHRIQRTPAPGRHHHGYVAFLYRAHFALSGEYRKHRYGDLHAHAAARRPGANTPGPGCIRPGHASRQRHAWCCITAW